MCQKINNEAKSYYIANKNNYTYCCGPYINFPCCCGYFFHFELLFLRDKYNGAYVQYMDVSCVKLSNNLFRQDSYEQLHH